ncbi:hypothetical protein NY97_19535 [Xanthomonas citri pv. fuscans]|nr:hypothetical protein NY97_19535 [Xanthomonas citri pv. fuscans]
MCNAIAQAIAKIQTRINRVTMILFTPVSSISALSMTRDNLRQQTRPVHEIACSILGDIQQMNPETKAQLGNHVVWFWWWTTVGGRLLLIASQ